LHTGNYGGTVPVSQLFHLGELTMTKKHFETLAAYVARIEDDYARRLAAIAVMNACAQSNPRFDAGRFLAACKVEL